MPRAVGVTHSRHREVLETAGDMRKMCFGNHVVKWGRWGIVYRPNVGWFHYKVGPGYLMVGRLMIAH
jgi:hypothetical protein